MKITSGAWRLLLMIGVFAVVSLIGAPAATAQVMDDGGDYVLNQDVNDPCPTYDSCTMYRWDSTRSGWVSARCKNPTPYGCQTCMSNNRCGFTTNNDYCECSDVPKQGAGPGITECQMYGACTYRSN